MREKENVGFLTMFPDAFTCISILILVRSRRLKKKKDYLDLGTKENYTCNIWKQFQSAITYHLKVMAIVKVFCRLTEKQTGRAKT